MAPLAYLLLFAVIALPIAWLASEFGSSRALRAILGIASIVSAIGVAYIVGHLQQLNYNAWYGSASKDLVETTISEIEDGNIDRVVNVLRRINLDYHPTYENRAHYDEIVTEAVVQMKGESILDDTKWDVSPLTRETWVGHWEDDSRSWLSIRAGAENFEILCSGNPLAIASDVTLSEDHRKLTFIDGSGTHHELRLKNKYEAEHICRDAFAGTTAKADVVHKLQRATANQKRFTQREIEEDSTSPPLERTPQ